MEPVEGTAGQRLKQIFAERSLPRFLAIGALNTAVGLGTFPVLYLCFSKWLGVNVMLAASYVLCTAFAFLSHAYITFRSSGAMRSKGVKFIALSAVNYVINVIVLNALLHATDWHPVLLQSIVAVALQTANFFAMNKLIFTAPSAERRS